MRRPLLALILTAIAAMTARATDQTILGQKLQVKDTSTPEKRKIVGVAKEKASADTLVGDPVTGGATLTVTANGGMSTSETYPLPTGTSAITSKPFWSGDSVKGFKYADPKGENGPVKKAQIKKSGSGVFSIKVTVDAKLAPVAVVPPNLGTDACLLLELVGGDTYSVKFGDGQVKNDGAKQFKISKPTIEGTCVTATTTTTTESPTSTTETTTTTIESTTTTTSPCPPGQALCGTCVDTTTDEANCGTCGHDCNAGAVNAIFTCLSSTCVFGACEPGFWDLDGDHTCEYSCQFVSPQETCNGADDNCNGLVDESLIPPTPSEVCGVSPSATSAECTSQVSVLCGNGAWQCTFPAGVCSGGCANAVEVCDALDNDCDGQLNENTPTFGQACASDDGLPPPGHGPCRTTGTSVCDGPTAVQCTAVKANCATLPGGCTEVPDTIDNDCDGSVDEVFTAKGVDPTFFVKPNVTRIGASLWIYSHEASRPTATSTSPGRGNGWNGAGAPAGVTLDKTTPASMPGRIGWFGVQALEAEQACATVGGALCTTAQAQTACAATASCAWGYSPRGAATCGSAATATKFCNLDAFDRDVATSGDQDGVIATGSPSLQACWADWSNLQGNLPSSDKIFDLTGNLRELTKTATNSYTVLGGSYYTEVEAGAACTFTTFQVAQTFAFRDTGFRCCFTQDPRL